MGGGWKGVGGGQRRGRGRWWAAFRLSHRGPPLSSFPVLQAIRSQPLRCAMPRDRVVGVQFPSYGQVGRGRHRCRSSRADHQRVGARCHGTSGRFGGEHRGGSPPRRWGGRSCWTDGGRATARRDHRGESGAIAGGGGGKGRAWLRLCQRSGTREGQGEGGAWGGKRCRSRRGGSGCHTKRRRVGRRGGRHQSHRERVGRHWWAVSMATATLWSLREGKREGGGGGIIRWWMGTRKGIL